jgi:hypothetical protein
MGDKNEIAEAAEGASGDALVLSFAGRSGIIGPEDLEGAPESSSITELLGAETEGVMLTKPEARDWDTDPLVVGQIIRCYLEQYPGDRDGEVSRCVEAVVQTASGIELVRCPARLSGAFLRAAGLPWDPMDPDRDGSFVAPDGYGHFTVTEFASSELDGVWRGLYVILRYTGRGRAKPGTKQSPPRMFEFQAFKLIRDIKAMDAALRSKLRMTAAATDDEL